MSETKPVIEERIYVGNVDFAATEEELKDFFTDLSVQSVEIPAKTITRGKKTFVKRLGFGFVQFETGEEADKAIESYNGKEFKGRNIYARKALPPATDEEKQKKTEAYYAKQKELKAKKAKAPVEKASVKEKDRKQDAGKAPEGAKSTDTVFITNLDYKVNVKALAHLFKEKKPKWIHVPARRVPYHLLKQNTDKPRPVFNKGIAFVKFDSEETQLQVIAEFNGTDLNGRTIIVETAVDRVVPEGTGEVQVDSDEAEEAAEDVIEEPVPEAVAETAA